MAHTKSTALDLGKSRLALSADRARVALSVAVNDEALALFRDVLAARRLLDLRDVPPAAQAALLGARCETVLPGVAELADLLGSGRVLTVKFGIDPTSPNVHLGHAVPMVTANMCQRMGHQVVAIVGDITAAIGDPSGRHSDRPALSADQITANMGSYRAQLSAFFDFAAAQLRFNSEWLGRIGLPEFVGTLAGVPASAVLQREDFRSRLAAGSGITMAELVYSVVMALDSVALNADIEIGGTDQLLNMQMCRRLMADAGQQPELVMTTPLVEGTDGTGAKMSKSAGNAVALSEAAEDVFGKLMSIPDRLIITYLAAFTHALPAEMSRLEQLMSSGAVNPMSVKTLLAWLVVETLHNGDVAHRAQRSFAARFSVRRLSDAPDIPVCDIGVHGAKPAAAVLVDFAGVSSRSQVRRVAAGGGLRLVAETVDSTQSVVVDRPDADLPVGQLHARVAGLADARVFLRCGRTALELAAV